MVSDYDDENGPPVCERCGEECHWCQSDPEAPWNEDEDE